MGNPLEAAEKLQGCVHVSQIQHFPIELRLLELKEVTRTLQQPSSVRRRVAVSTLLAPMHPGILSSSENLPLRRSHHQMYSVSSMRKHAAPSCPTVSTRCAGEHDAVPENSAIKAKVPPLYCGSYLALVRAPVKKLLKVSECFLGTFYFFS